MALLLTQPKVEKTAAPDWMAMKVQDEPKGSVAAARSATEPTVARPTVDFARDIAPLLDRSCAACHGADKKKGKFTIASREAMLAGGQSGEPAVHPGNSAGSKLLRMVSDQVEDLEMPPLSKRNNYPALTKGELALFKTWIDEGLPWGATTPQQP
jgi:hypothetical protein